MKFADSIDFQSSTSRQGQNSLLFRFHIDLPLFLGLLLISVTSLLILYSAGDQDLELIYRQSIRLGVAFVVMLVLAQIAPHHIQRWAPWLFAEIGRAHV